MVLVDGTQTLPLGDAALTLYPPLGAGRSNESGLFALCSYRDFDVLITGDADAFVEKMLVKYQPIPDVEVLLAGHHGSKNSSCGEFLRAVSPELVLISAGANNAYGHPAPETLERLEAAGPLDMVHCSNSAGLTAHPDWSGDMVRAGVDNTAMRELKQAIKEGAPKKLYLFHGEEAFLREYYLGQLKQALLPAGLEEFNLHAAQGKDCSVDWIEQAADCLPMMSGRTLVIVTDFDLYGLGEKPRERLVKVLEELPDYCCMVFVYDLLPYKADGRSKLAGLLKREGAVVDFQRQSQGDLTDWICRQFKKAGKGVDTEDARYLIFLCGDLMNTLSAEIAKIAAYSPHTRVTREDMDAVAIPQIDAVVFQMTDAMARKDFDKAASVLADLLHSQQPPIMILAAMGKYFRQLYTARLYLDRGKGRGEFMELWGMKSGYQADKLMDAARRFSLPWCRYAVGRCAQADIELKSSYGQERELLTGLLMELASGRRAAVTFS